MTIKLIIISFTLLFVVNNLKDITGKWQVENVDISKMTMKLTDQQKEVMNKAFIIPLKNAVFDFEADHHFYLSANFNGMPKNDVWEYNETTNIITVREYNKPQSAIMKIKIFTKADGTYFELLETPVILKVKR